MTAVRRLILAGVVIVLAVLLGLAGTASAAPVGFGFSIPGIESPARHPAPGASLDRAKGLGATWVRFDIPWAATERMRGVYDWSRYDAIVDLALVRGLRPLVILDYNNPLYSGKAEMKAAVRTSANRAGFAAWARATAAHFAGRVTAYEVWNEPNHAYFWQPKPRASEYAALLRAAYPAVKAGDPSALVIGGAMAVGGSVSFVPPVDFLTGMYSAGARGYFDALSDHPSTGPRHG